MSQEMTSLFRLAIASGRAETVRSHLERGADANARDNTGSPALLIAASRGRQDICEILLEHGADPAASDASGRTLSEYALQWGFVNLIGVRDEQSPEPELFPAQVNCVPVSAADEGEEMFGWEPEIVSGAPAEDTVQIGAAHAAHDVFSRANARMDAADWSSVAAELPRSLGSLSDRLPPEVEAMVSRGLNTGWISGASLRSSLPTAKIRGELAIPLKVVLSDLGISIRDSVYEDMLLPDNAPPVEAIRDEELLTEVGEHVSALAGQDIESRYLLKTRALREDAAGIQPILWARVEELRRRAAAAFASLPGGLQHLEAAGAAFTGSEDDEPVGDDLVDAADGDGDEPDRFVDEAEEDHPADHQFSNALINLSEEEFTDHLIELRLPLAVMKRAVEFAAVDPVAGVETIRAILDELETRLASIVETNLSLVTWFANRYRSRGVEYLDVVQEGNIGLMNAVQRFDPSRGVSLVTYAIWWIRQAITRAIADTGRTIRVPVHVQDNARKLQRVRETLGAETGAQPTAEEVARKMEMTELSVARLEAITAQFVSTKGDNVERLKRGMTEGLPDPAPGPDATTWEWELRKELDDRLADLDIRQARVLRLRFGMAGNDEHTLEEIGALYGVTRERIRQIEAKALKIMAHPSRSRELKVFLDE
ncbi:sigma-70 family RNA polymerase sigma factor [Brucella anthropi]|uniref:sigma-70 family RNA polymerase sigma factor n=1 Tax=Brucella anthropi TaxID=529 RepID=UPI00124EA0B9|nr:sigma-70 family RNA polymerase sigma factor [Brucella anthropi]KAB2735805.1 sigma-70 family RNA polymerase sigma factor [Brucella anthropi]